MKRSLLVLVALALHSATLWSQNVSVLTQHGDNKRTGWNPRETKLTTANVSQASFGRSYAMTVDDQIYAQPLVISNISISGAAHNIVLVATVSNTVYAFDADRSGTFWSKNYTVAGQRPPTHKDMTGACGGNYNDFSGNIGIVGTPVIDSATSTMYFVARSTDGPAGSNGTGNFSQYLHAIDITTGNERANSPVLINASIAGSGDGSVNGTLSFNAQHENQRTGLLLVNGIVYLTYAAHCDWPPYHGWILGYDKTSLTQKTVYNTTPDGYNGGIWMSGSGPAADENGNIYVSVGNGSVGTTSSGLRNYSESALKLTPSGNTLAISSFFTPGNWQALENADLDFGVTQIMLLPNTTTAVTGCKDGNIYVLNRDNLGGFNATTNNVLQTIPIGSGKTLRSSLAYYSGSSKSWLYTWSENAALKAFPYNPSTGVFDQNNVVIGSAQGPTGSNGTLLSVSSNGSKDGTGILWASHAASGDANQSVRPGILRAFDANDVTKELWNSNQKSGDNIGSYAKFVSPTIANGKVYMATFSKQLLVYGVNDTASAGVCNGVADLARGKTAVASSIESSLLPASNAADSNLTTRWASVANVDPQWIYIDLGARYDVCKVQLNWETALGKDFQIQIADDTTHWTTIKAVTGNTSFSNTLYVKGTGRYVRMLGTARGSVYGYSLYEFLVFGTAANSCITPSALTASGITRTGASLGWAAITGVNSYNVKYKTVSASAYMLANVTTNSLSLKTLTCGTDYLFNVQAVCSASSSSVATGDKAFSTLTCDTACGFLPTRWFTQDIGKVGVTGASCYNNSKFRLQASGTDIWNNADGFQYAYKTFTGDGSVTARIDSITAGNPWAKAGVMFRETLDSTSRQAIMALTPTTANGAAFQYRQLAGSSSSNVNLQGIQLPYYVKIVKRGTSFAGYISPDSVVWKQVGTAVNLGFGTGPIEAGLALTSHDNVNLAKAVFSHVPIIFSADTSVNTSYVTCPPGNIALNRPAASSSTLSTDKSIYEFKAFDGDTSTHWTSASGTDTQWLYVDLGKRFQVCQVSLLWGLQYAQNYQIQVSDDAVTWNTIKSVTGNTVRQNVLSLSGTGRFLRLYATSRGTTLGYSVSEMQVSGTAVAGQPLNIALNKPATPSSTENTTLTAAASVDGIGYTRWASVGGTDPSWIYVDLGKTYTISQVLLDWEVALAKDFQIQISADAISWTTVKTVTGNTLYTNFIPVTGSGRYVRMYGTKRGTPYGYSLYEFEVYGVASGLTAKAASIQPAAIIYPVPASNQIMVSTLDNMTGNIYIYDLSTNTTSSAVYISKDSKKAVLDISNYRNGLYILTIDTNQGRISKVVRVAR